MSDGTTVAVRGAPQMRNLVGTLVAGHRLLGLLGGGAHGAVYLAQRPDSGPQVAVKVLRPGLASPSAAERLADHVRAIAWLGHPNVVEVHELATLPDGALAFVTDFVTGRTLEAATGDQPVALERALGLLGQLAGGLEAIHARGLAHLGVAPGNLLLAADDSGAEVLKLVDLGLAPLRTGGTSPYIAPEVRAGRPGDARSDVYGAAAVAWKLLAGKPPAEALLARVDVPLPALPHVPEAVHDVLERALSRDPAQRPATVARLVDELKTASEPAIVEGGRAFREAFTDGVLHVRFKSTAALREALASELAHRRLAVAGQPPDVDGPFKVELQLPDRRSWSATARLERPLEAFECVKAGIDHGFLLAFDPRPGEVTPPPRRETTPEPLRSGPPPLRSRRHKVRIPGICRLERGHEPGWTVDVSSRGLCVITPSRRAKGSQLVVTLMLPTGSRAEVEATVAWSAPAADSPGLFANGLKLVTAHEAYFTWLQDVALSRPVV